MEVSHHGLHSQPTRYFDIGVVGRRTGIKMKPGIKKDADGLDNIDDFWNDENIKTGTTPSNPEVIRGSSEDSGMHSEADNEEPISVSFVYEDPVSGPDDESPDQLRTRAQSRGQIVRNKPRQNLYQEEGIEVARRHHAPHQVADYIDSMELLLPGNFQRSPRGMIRQPVISEAEAAAPTPAPVETTHHDADDATMREEEQSPTSSASSMSDPLFNFYPPSELHGLELHTDSTRSLFDAAQDVQTLTPNPLSSNSNSSSSASNQSILTSAIGGSANTMNQISQTLAPYYSRDHSFRSPERLSSQEMPEIERNSVSTLNSRVMMARDFLNRTNIGYTSISETIPGSRPMPRAASERRGKALSPIGEGDSNSRSSGTPHNAFDFEYGEASFVEDLDDVSEDHGNFDDGYEYLEDDEDEIEDEEEESFRTTPSTPSKPWHSYLLRRASPEHRSGLRICLLSPERGPQSLPMKRVKMESDTMRELIRPEFQIHDDAGPKGDDNMHEALQAPATNDVWDDEQVPATMKPGYIDPRDVYPAEELANKAEFGEEGLIDEGNQEHLADDEDDEPLINRRRQYGNPSRQRSSPRATQRETSAKSSSSSVPAVPSIATKPKPVKSRRAAITAKKVVNRPLYPNQEVAEVNRLKAQGQGSTALLSRKAQPDEQGHDGSESAWSSAHDVSVVPLQSNPINSQQQIQSLSNSETEVSTESSGSMEQTVKQPGVPYRLEKLVPQRRLLNDEPAGVRRSKRTMYKPLHFWENEKVIMGRSDHTPLPVPVVKGILRPLKHEPEYSRSERMSKARSTRKRRKFQKVQVSEDEGSGMDSESSLSDHPKLKDNAIHRGEAKDSAGQIVVQNLAEAPKYMHFRDTPGGQYQFHRGLEDEDCISSGIVRIPVGGTKPNKNAYASSIVRFLYVTDL
ncbi:hypothetical protein EDD11_008952 [Mortierella claussenii]|nr:hypothetical protein EDD11_008952 [Mortierella claussenii]